MSINKAIPERAPVDGMIVASSMSVEINE